MDYLIEQFGEPNESIDEELLDDILEELGTLKDHSYELALASIELGKPQILEYLLNTNEFSSKETRNFKKHVEDYVEHEEGNDVEEIVIIFENLIKSAENPRNKNWKV